MSSLPAGFSSRINFRVGVIVILAAGALAVILLRIFVW